MSGLASSSSHGSIVSHYDIPGGLERQRVVIRQGVVSDGDVARRGAADGDTGETIGEVVGKIAGRQAERARTARNADGGG